MLSSALNRHLIPLTATQCEKSNLFWWPHFDIFMYSATSRLFSGCTRRQLRNKPCSKEISLERACSWCLAIVRGQRAHMLCCRLVFCILQHAEQSRLRGCASRINAPGGPRFPRYQRCRHRRLRRKGAQADCGRDHVHKTESMGTT